MKIKKPSRRRAAPAKHTPEGVMARLDGEVADQIVALQKRIAQLESADRAHREQLQTAFRNVGAQHGKLAARVDRLDGGPVLATPPSNPLAETLPTNPAAAHQQLSRDAVTTLREAAASGRLGQRTTPAAVPEEPPVVDVEPAGAAELPAVPEGVAR